MKILVFNAGSSSLKYELFDIAGRKNLKSIYRANIDNYGKPIKNFNYTIKNVMDFLVKKKFIQSKRDIGAIGHRVVHGAEIYCAPVKITAKVIKNLEKISPLAPLHLPANIAVIRACGKIFPHARQIAVFDTAFYAGMPQRAHLYALPYSFYKKYGIKKYGFHGINHQYVYGQAQSRLGDSATRRTVSCHLGNGCSITAIMDGKAVDTSMGFTPLEGVPMGTRSGNIDPAIIFYLMERGMKPQEILKTLNEKSGLKGISGISADMRTLWRRYGQRNKNAVRALDIFTYRIAKCIGAFAAALGGLDCIIFTGGIGENAPYIRKMIMKYILKIAQPSVLVIPANESRQIARFIAQP